MVTDIIDAISIKINELFGEGYEIYTENVKQGLTEPCFFIRLVSASVTPYLGQRKLRAYPVMVTYFPKDTETNDDLMQIGELLCDGLEYVTMVNGDIVRGWNVSSEIDADQNVLHISVEYRITTIVPEELIPMEDMTQQTGLKSED